MSPARQGPDAPRGGRRPGSGFEQYVRSSGGNRAFVVILFFMALALLFFSFIERKADVSKADRLKEMDLPGIYFIDDTRREYPYGQTGGQVIGACSIEVDEEANREYYVGICGLEM